MRLLRALVIFCQIVFRLHSASPRAFGSTLGRSVAHDHKSRSRENGEESWFIPSLSLSFPPPAMIIFAGQPYGRHGTRATTYEPDADLRR